MRTALAAALVLIAPACNAYETAIEIDRNCRLSSSTETIEVLRYMHCSAYITGVIDGVLMLQTKLAPEQQLLCPPNNYLAPKSSEAAVLGWLSRNPSRLNSSARVAVLSALIDAFPCGRK